MIGRLGCLGEGVKTVGPWGRPLIWKSPPHSVPVLAVCLLPLAESALRLIFANSIFDLTMWCVCSPIRWNYPQSWGRCMFLHKACMVLLLHLFSLQLWVAASFLTEGVHANRRTQLAVHSSTSYPRKCRCFERFQIFHDGFHGRSLVGSVKRSIPRQRSFRCRWASLLADVEFWSSL